MGAARDLTMGPRRGRSPSDPRITELNRLTRAKRFDGEGLRRLVEDVNTNSARSFTRSLGMAVELARVRYATETGEVLPGSYNPYLESLRRPAGE